MVEKMEIKTYIGGRITEPGIYSKIPLWRYHEADICDGPSLSSSGMRTIIRDGEADFWDTCPLNPNKKEVDEDKIRHFVLGRAAHHIVLGEPFFSKLFIIRPDEINGKPYHWNSKNWQKWEAEQHAARKTILTQAEAERVRGMMLSLGRYPLIAQRGILNGRIELSMFWKDKKTGIWLRARPDAIPEDCADVADLKTTKSVKFLSLQKTLEEYGYHQQGALIREAWRIFFPEREQFTFALVFIQSTRPYSVRSCTVEPEDLDRGEKLNRQAINSFVSCLKSGTWPGPGGFQSDLQSLALTKRAREHIDNTIQYGNIL